MSLTPEQIQYLNKMTGLNKPTTPQELDAKSRATEFAQRYETMRTNEAQGGSDTSFKDLPGNILPSAGKALSGIGSAIASPKQTAKGLLKTAVGAAEAGGRKLIEKTPIGDIPNIGNREGATLRDAVKVTPKSENEEAAGAIGQYFADRYGGLDKAKQTLINDPSGFLLDLSTVFDGVGGALGTVGKVSKIGALTDAGKVVSKAGEVTNPISMAATGVTKAAKTATNLAGKAGAEVLGLTTGAGPNVIKEAFSNTSPELASFMRGKSSKSALVDTAEAGLQGLKDSRSAEYQSKLAEIGKNVKSIDISPVNAELDNQLNKFSISNGPDGSLDFSKSYVPDSKDATVVQGIVDTIKDWGSDAGDRTPIGLDKLKRRIDSFYSDSSNVRAFTQGIKSSISKLLEKEVPGYSEMTKSYRKASDFINEFQEVTKVGGNAAKESAITKLAQGLKEDKELRTSVIKEFESKVGKDITGPIAGAALNSWVPRSLANKLLAGGAIGTISPLGILGIAVSLTSFSPRVVGELVRGLGVGAKKVEDVVKAIKIVKSKIPGGDVSLDALIKAGVNLDRVKDAGEK